MHILGSDESWQQFYIPHLQYVSELHPEDAIIIDNTGIPNNIKINLTQKSDHNGIDSNGIDSNGIKLILALDGITGIPFYLRYVA